MGYTGAEDEGVWARMVGGDWEEEGEEELKDERPPLPKAKAPPPKPATTKTGARISSESILSWMTHQMEPSPPPPKKKTPP